MRRATLALLLLVAATSARAGLPAGHRSGFEAFACQDGVRQEAEQCDDGDADDFDGCTSQCRRAPACDAVAFPSGAAFAIDPVAGRCFVLSEEQTTFEAANTACVALGGHLATLTSAADTARIAPLLATGARPWIGATDELVEGSFAWLTGEPGGYANFAAGQPDGDGDCVHLGDAAGAWHDTDCGLVGMVGARLCEIEPP